MRNISPDIIINNRVGKGRQGMQGMNKDENSVGDFGTPEQEILETSSAFPWESCMTMNDSWGFKKGDDNWKSANTLIHNIIDIVSKGGNYLLNVGPDSKGLIPDASIERLEKVGEWMKVNGEGIYDTRPIKNYFEGDYIRYTTKKDSDLVYLFLLKNPENSELSFSYVTPKEGSKIYLLGNDMPLSYQVTNGITTVEFPEDYHNNTSPICLKIDGLINEVSQSPNIIINGIGIHETYLFQDETEIALSSEGGKIYYTTDGTFPNHSSNEFISSIKIDKSIFLKTVTIEEGKVNSPPNSVQFYKIQSIEDLILKNDLSAKYRANGKLSLVDGKRGTIDYQENWLGFEGEDVEVTIDLGKVKKINGIHLGSLSNINSWIFLPKKVTFFISDNNKDFKKISEFNYSVDRDENQGGFIKDISSLKPVETRYIKVIAESIQECPDWHIGRGGKAWLFFDEIIID